MPVGPRQSCCDRQRERQSPGREEREGGGEGEQLSAAQCGRNLKRQWPVVCSRGTGWQEKQQPGSMGWSSNGGLWAGGQGLQCMVEWERRQSLQPGWEALQKRGKGAIGVCSSEGVGSGPSFPIPLEGVPQAAKQAQQCSLLNWKRQLIRFGSTRGASHPPPTQSPANQARGG